MQERTPLRTPGANYISDLLWVGTSPSTSLVRNIAETLALEIVEGKVNPGYPMNSVHLSRRFRCSRTPVREALVALEREGLVTIPPRRRPYVSPITWRQARESYELRIHLLELVSRLVVANASDDDLRRLEEHQKVLEIDAAAGDIDSYFWHNVAFRQVEAEISGNTELAHVLKSLGLRTLQLRHVSLFVPGRMATSVLRHRELLRAYCDRDLGLATRINRAIIERGLDAMSKSNWPGLTHGPEAPTGS